MSDGCSEEEHNICQVFINETVAHNLEEIENGKHEKWLFQQVDDAIMMDNYHIYYILKRVCDVCRSCGQKYIHQLAFT